MNRTYELKYECCYPCVSMEKTQFQRLQSSLDLLTFKKHANHFVGVDLPTTYLEKALVIGLKNKRGDIYGGFVMAYDGPLRCLEQLPEKVLREHDLLIKNRSHCFEINGLWLNKSQAPQGSRLQLYLECMKYAIRLGLKGKHKYVYAYSSNNDKLREFYKNFNSWKIYEGPVKALPGCENPGSEVIEMGCIKRLPVNIAKNPTFLMDRAFNGTVKKLKWIS